MSIERIADALDKIVAVINEERAESAAEKEEAKREGRDGEWVTRWYVKCAEKGHVLYKSQGAAYEGGRYWLTTSAEPDSVEVYCVESKQFPADVVDRGSWSL